MNVITSEISSTSNTRVNKTKALDGLKISSVYITHTTLQLSTIVTTITMRNYKHTCMHSLLT